MTSMMVSAGDLDIMMLEFAVEKLFVPKTSVFDSVIMKKTTVMFRMLDSEWIPVNPNRRDYAPYRGSNAEETNFHGGKSVVFAIPAGSLAAAAATTMRDVDIQIHVINEVSKYFQANPGAEKRQRNVGVALANVDRLFNGIIKELRERDELGQYLNCFHRRQPISRSLKETYEMVDEEEQQRRTGATIGIYARLSYLGKSVITEIDGGLGSTFRAQEETNEGSPYQCRELKPEELDAGRWPARDADEFSSVTTAPSRLRCRCSDEFGAFDEVRQRPARSPAVGAGAERDAAGKTVDDVSGDVEKRSEKKSSGRRSRQVSEIAKINKSNAGAPMKKTKTKTKNPEKPVRTSRSADEKLRRPREEASIIIREQQEEADDEGPSGGRKRRAASARDKRPAGGDSRDRRAIGKLDKATAGDVGTAVAPRSKPSPATKEQDARLLELLLLRKRRRGCGGNVTVGILDKRKNVCPVVQATETPTCSPRQTAPTSQLCPADFRGALSPISSCYYARSYDCQARAASAAAAAAAAGALGGCFVDATVRS